ncbi:MAG: hypothetical protein ACLGHL_03540 [Actinomycetota bacterium]
MDEMQDERRSLEQAPLALVGFNDREEADWVCELVELNGFIAAAIEDPFVLPSLIRTERPDLLIVDLAMIFPGISTTLGKIRGTNPDMTAVVILPDDIVEAGARQDIAMALGFDLQIARPLSPVVLAGVLRRVVAERGVALNGGP